jgi:hypothetical protein
MRFLANLKIPTQPSSLLVIRRTTSAISALMGFPPETIDEVTLAVSELCSNYLTPIPSMLNITYQEEDASLVININGPKPSATDESLLSFLLASSLMDCSWNNQRGYRLKKSFILISPV